MKTAVTFAAGVMLGLLGGYYYGITQGVASLVAPVNEEAITRLTTSMETIIGRWQSTQDGKFMREFRGDGVLVDSYEGNSADITGRWMLFSKDIPDPAYAGPLEDNALYLAIAAPESETLYFEIVKLNESELELIYLNRGGVLTFTRVQ